MRVRGARIAVAAAADLTPHKQPAAAHALAIPLPSGPHYVAVAGLLIGNKSIWLWMHHQRAATVGVVTGFVYCRSTVE
jgi:hypothetical protein